MSRSDPLPESARLTGDAAYLANFILPRNAVALDAAAIHDHAAALEDGIHQIGLAGRMYWRGSIHAAFICHFEYRNPALFSKPQPLASMKPRTALRPGPLFSTK